MRHACGGARLCGRQQWLARLLRIHEAVQAALLQRRPEAASCWHRAPVCRDRASTARRCSAGTRSTGASCWGRRIMLAGHLLASKGDRVAMWESVELRPPFLDEDLVGYTNRLHPRWKLRRFTEKYILRKMAEKWVPREIARRPKKMFRAPLDSFHLIGPDRPQWIDQVLSPESLKKTGYFDRGGGQEDTATRSRRCGGRWPEDQHRDGTGGGDGHAVVASPVHQWRPGDIPSRLAYRDAELGRADCFERFPKVGSRLSQFAEYAKDWRACGLDGVQL